MNKVLKQTFLLSCVGHLACLSVLGFSFGPRPAPVKTNDLFYWGGFRMLASSPGAASPTALEGIFLKERLAKMVTFAQPHSLLPIERYTKPLAAFAQEEKMPFAAIQVNPRAVPPVRKEQIVMFYPQLPYQVSLYFKDRQVIRIGLMFNVAPQGHAGAIAIKRKISSGNLEADLLSMRYISRYLTVQRMGYAPGSWQSVEIELSTSRDDTR